MGEVYRARDTRLGRDVAINVLPEAFAKDAILKERFEREAKAAAKMQHPAIVTIFDVGLDNGSPYMVLEYLPGESLADRLDQVRMPLGRAVQIGLDLASALGGHAKVLAGLAERLRLLVARAEAHIGCRLVLEKNKAQQEVG